MAKNRVFCGCEKSSKEETLCVKQDGIYGTGILILDFRSSEISKSTLRMTITGGRTGERGRRRRGTWCTGISWPVETEPSLPSFRILENNNE